MTGRAPRLLDPPPVTGGFFHSPGLNLERVDVKPKADVPNFRSAFGFPSSVPIECGFKHLADDGSDSFFSDLTFERLREFRAEIDALGETAGPQSCDRVQS